MTQVEPTYKYATGKCEKPIIDALVSKYGISNVTWPIVLSNSDGKTVAYLYERTEKNTINCEMDSRPGSSARILSYYLDYLSKPRSSLPRNVNLSSVLQDKYKCSYDFVIDSSRFSSVDLDYVWYDGTRYRGFEFTTFYTVFDTCDKALNIISKMSKRPSWQSDNGARAFHKIVDSAQDLGVDYYLVCANTVDKEVGSPLKTDGNVCLLPMNHEQVNVLEHGNRPQTYSFMRFQQFLKWQ